MILPEAQKKKTTRVDIALQKLAEEKKLEEQKKRERASTKVTNHIRVISSNISLPVVDIGNSSISSQLEIEKPIPVSDQMIDRLQEREEKKSRLILEQLQAEKEAHTVPTKPQKQYGLELLKQKIQYDDEYEDQRTETHKVSEIELKEPVKNRYESQNNVLEEQNIPPVLNDPSDFQSSSALYTQKNLFVAGDYDHQSQHTEQSPFKRDAPVVKIEGLRMNME